MKLYLAVEVQLIGNHIRNSSLWPSSLRSSPINNVDTDIIADVNSTRSA